MLILRLVGVLALISIGASLLFYALTRDRRWLAFAWRLVQFVVVFLAVFGVFYVAERLLLAA